MSTTIRPIGDRILVKRDETKKESSGGIVLPDKAQEGCFSGKVLAVGSGQLLDDGLRSTMEVKEGDRIIFASFSGAKIEVDDEEFVCVRETDVLCVL